MKTLTFFILFPFMISLHLLFNIVYGDKDKMGWYQKLWDRGKWKYLGWVLWPFVWMWGLFMSLVYPWWSELLD